MTPQDEITLIKWTVAMEAEGEPFLGKLAVAYVICNRMRQWKQSAADVCLRKWQFSGWNTDSPTRMRLDEISDKVMLEARKAAEGAYYQHFDDPTKGAVYYLNPTMTRALRGGTLPEWWYEDTDPESEVVIGKHVFRRSASRKDM